MKKILLLFCLLLPSLCIKAEKSYLTVWVGYIVDYPETSSYGQGISITGDIPKEVDDFYNKAQGMHIGDLLTTLSKSGYDVESMTSSEGGVIFLLSKASSTTNAIKGIQSETKNNDDSDAVEIARYNLQGIPVNKNNKGIQIIVYSDYTTKTILVQ